MGRLGKGHSALSIGCMNYVWTQSQAKGSERLVLLCLADRANDDGICWPSAADTAARARLSERQTRRILGQLREQGEIITIRKGGGTRIVKGRECGITDTMLVVAGRSEDELMLALAKHGVPPDNATALIDPTLRSKRDNHAVDSEGATLSPATGNPDTGVRGTTNRTGSEPSRESPTGRVPSFGWWLGKANLPCGVGKRRDSERGCSVCLP